MSADAILIDVIIPVHNAAATIEQTVHSAMRQERIPHDDDDDDGSTIERHIHVHVCCYDDGSTDDSWKRLTALEEMYRSNAKVKADDESNNRLPSTLLVSKSLDGLSRGAGFARNRAAHLSQLSSSTCDNHFLCMLDSDDTMHRHRVAYQVQAIMSIPVEERQRTLVGCQFDRDPPDSTWHYAQWANGLTDERLILERFREVTLIQPTWMVLRSRWKALGCYLEAPTAEVANKESFHVVCQQLLQADPKPLIHSTYDTLESLRIAEDLRFFHTHLENGGLLKLVRRPLVVYKHRQGQSQSAQTPRRLLVHLRVLALERSVLSKSPWREGFCIWGAGRDGKDFVKALCPDIRKQIVCMVDVDSKKLQSGFYRNRDIEANIPIIHFAYLIQDPTTRDNVLESWMSNNEAGFGNINKSKSHDPIKPPPEKKRKTLPKLPKGLDFDLLGRLPVIVCVAMYRTNGALERNIGTISRVEGQTLWHFS